jgi:hypothetical protein
LRGWEGGHGNHYCAECCGWCLLLSCTHVRVGCVCLACCKGNLGLRTFFLGGGLLEEYGMIVFVKVVFFYMAVFQPKGVCQLLKYESVFQYKQTVQQNNFTPHHWPQIDTIFNRIIVLELIIN